MGVQLVVLQLSQASPSPQVWGSLLLSGNAGHQMASASRLTAPGSLIVDTECVHACACVCVCVPCWLSCNIAEAKRYASNNNKQSFFDPANKAVFFCGLKWNGELSVWAVWVWIETHRVIALRLNSIMLVYSGFVCLRGSMNVLQGSEMWTWSRILDFCRAQSLLKLIHELHACSFYIVFMLEFNKHILNLIIIKFAHSYFFTKSMKRRLIRVIPAKWLRYRRSKFKNRRQNLTS